MKNDIQNSSIPEFSFFKKPVSNTIPYKTINLLDVYGLIRGNWNMIATNLLRGVETAEMARQVKARFFNYVCFSGVFTKRNENNLVKHSGLVVIDFDHLPCIEKVKQLLLNDDYFETELLFRSPSGDGLKWVIPIDLSKETHKNYFTAISNYLKHTYSLEADNSGKDVARACFLPNDPNVYINPKYLQYA